MNLILPDGNKIKLYISDDIEKKKAKVNELLQSWEEYFRSYWKSNSTSVCLDILATYLIREKKNNDQEVLSFRKIKRMEKGDPKIKHFDQLSLESKLRFGLIDIENNDELEE